MTDSKFCSGCLRDDEENEGESWCSDCSEIVCKTCAKVHKRFNPPHKVMPLHQVSDLGASVLHINKFCDVHSDQKIILFCTQHDKVICDLCLSDSHTNCKSVISIERAARGVKNGTALEDLQARLTNLCKLLHSVLKSKKENLMSLEKQKEDVLKQISDARHQIDKHMDKIESEVKDELEKQYTICKKKVEENRKDLERRETDLQKWMKDITGLKSSSNEIHFFQAIKLIDTKTHKEETEILNQSKFIQIEFRLLENISKFSNIFKSMGQIFVTDLEMKVSASQDKHHQGQVPKGQGKAAVSAETNYSEEVDKKQMNNSSKNSRTHSFDTSLFGRRVEIWKGCFISKGKVLLPDNNNTYLYVCNYDGTEIKTIKLEAKPFDVASIDSRQAIVALGKEGYQIFDLATFTLGKCIHHDGYACYGVACSNGEIWFRAGGCRICYTDKSGKLLGTIKTRYSPSELCVNDDGNIYYVTPENDSVYFITEEGQESMFYSSSDLRGTRSIDVDDGGFVYVDGCKSDNIHKISSDGRSHQIILTEEDGMDIPTGLRYCNETKNLLIINNNMKRIEIYHSS